jgi:hypothetical protein
MMFVLIFAGLVFLYAFAVVRVCQIRVARRAIRLFVVTGSLLTLLRVSTLSYLSYRMRGHTFSEAMLLVSYVLWPESTFMTLIRQPNLALDFLLTTALLAVGSFLWALPILLLWGVKNRQQNPSSVA